MAGVAHGEKRKRKYRKHGAYGDYESKLLAHNAEHRVGISCEGALEPAVARSLSEQAAGGSGRQSMRLLIAAVPYILGIPYMPPCGKALCYMILHFEHQEAGHARSRNGQSHGRYRARAHKGYDEEGHEEYERRAEVAAECKADDTQRGKCDEKYEVFGAEQPVKRRSADIDERDLYKLRGLDRHRSDEYPVFRAVLLASENEHRGKDQHRQYRQRKAHGLCPVKIAQPPAESKERGNARKNDQHLAEHFVRHGRGYDGKADRREEKRKRFDLKARAPYAAHGKIAEPLEQYQQRKAQHYAGKIFALSRAQVLKQKQRLKKRQEKQRHRRMHALPALRSARLYSVTLLFAYVPKAHAVSGKIENVAVVNDRARALNLFAVYPNSALGEDIEYAPHALWTAYEYGVHAADRGVWQADIRRPRAAYEVFPVVYERHSVVSVDIAPDLRLRFAAEHTAHAADKDDDRKQREYI